MFINYSNDFKSQWQSLHVLNFQSIFKQMNWNFSAILLDFLGHLWLDIGVVLVCNIPTKSPLENTQVMLRVSQRPWGCKKSKKLGLRGASYYGRQVERTLYKLSSRRQGRSPLNYINCRLCITLGRKVFLLKESLGFHKYWG
jgi:hypothetical protein